MLDRANRTMLPNDYAHGSPCWCHGSCHTRAFSWCRGQSSRSQNYSATCVTDAGFLTIFGNTIGHLVILSKNDSSMRRLQKRKFCVPFVTFALEMTTTWSTPLTEGNHRLHNTSVIERAVSISCGIVSVGQSWLPGSRKLSDLQLEKCFRSWLRSTHVGLASQSITLHRRNKILCQSMIRWAISNR